MSEHTIPDDLTGRYIELTRWDKGPLDGMQMPWQCSLREEAALIERIAKLEAERDELKAKLNDETHAAAEYEEKLVAANERNAQLRASLALADTRAINLKAGLGKMADALAWLQQPVTDEEWERFGEPITCSDDEDGLRLMCMEEVNALLAARAAGKGE